MRAYLLNLLVAIDQLGSALTGGAADETISSRLGKAARGDYGPAAQRWTAPLRWFVDGLFRLLAGQRHHCATHIEEDEGWNSL